MKKHLIICLSSIILFANASITQTATFKGRVTDSQTGGQLVGVNVLIEGSRVLGCSTGISGFYEIKDVPVGQQIISLDYIGYCPMEDTIIVTKDSLVYERNYKLKNQCQKVELKYPIKYKLYHRRIHGNMGNANSQVRLRLDVDTTGSETAIIIYPVIENRCGEKIYFVNRLDGYEVRINSRRFDTIETTHRYGCPMHLYPESYEEREIIEIDSGSSKRIAGFFILKKDLSKFRNKPIHLKLRYRYKLPDSVPYVGCSNPEMEELKERYYKLFNEKLVSPEVELECKSQQ